MIADLIKSLDAERKRQGLTKQQLAERCDVPSASMRRLLGGKVSDVKLSTVLKISGALGMVIEFKTIDAGVPRAHRKLLMERIRRRSLAERLGKRTGLDAGDIEHALFNLTLSPDERLRRRFRGRSTHR